MKSGRTTIVCALCLALGASALPAARALAQPGADWQPRLDPSADPAGRGPEEPFVIRLSAPYDASSGRLALELDNVDVTSHVRPLDDAYTVFELTPYTALSRGTHVLRMVEYANDGSIIERGRWSFVVRTIESAFDAGVDASASYRFDESPDDLAWPGRTQAQGSVLFDAYTDNGARRYAATGNLLIDTNAAATAAMAGTGAGGVPDDVDLGDFLLSLDTQNVNVSAGHHAPATARRSLIFDGYPRRGLSTTVSTDDGATSFTAYALRTENIRGFDHGLGVSDPDNRIAGGSLRIQPTANVALGLGYVSGEGSDAGFGTGTNAAPLEGSAGNFAFDSVWLEQRLSVRAEAAFSDVDLGESFGTAGGRAYVAGATWRPHQGLRLGEHYVPWNLDLSYARVGSQFRSVANLQQVANVEEVRAAFNAYVSGLSLSLAGARVEDNVESELYPSTRSDNVNVSLSWAPIVAADFGGALFARPTVGLNLIGDERETVRMPAVSLALPTDMDTRGYTTFVGFGHRYGTWTVSYGSTDVDDDTGVVPDYRYRTAALQATFQVGTRYSVTPGLQYDVARDLGTGLEQRSTNLSLSQSWMLVTDRLYWTLSLGHGGNRVSDDTSDLAQSFLNTTLSWRKRRFTLWLQGAWNDVDNETLDMLGGVTAFSQDQYQLLLGVSVNWPGRGRAAPSAATAAVGGLYR